MSSAWSQERKDNLSKRNAENKRKYPKQYDCKSRLYRIWRCMYFRCYQLSHKAYLKYGGNGIIICSEWLNDYSSFMNWAINNGYQETLTIDRIDNAKGYYPDNCRWATRKSQNYNKTNNLPPLEAFGEKKYIHEWVADSRCIVSYRCIWKRLASGRTLEWALITPQNKERRCLPMSQITKDKIAEKAKLRTVNRDKITGRIIS